MNAIEHLESVKWERPSHYAGFSPDGDYLIVSQHRESGSIDRSNYTCAFKQLQELCADLPAPPDEPDTDSFPRRRDRSQRSEGWVYDFRASHPLVGWIEYLLVRADAPDNVLEAAGEIICSLADYPILDENHHSELEWEECADYWARMSVRDRMEILKDSGTSMFAARRDEMPHDDNGYIFEQLRD